MSRIDLSGGIKERLHGVAHIPKEYLCEAPPAPRSAKIELTGQCNYHCKFCAISERRWMTADMDFGFFKAIAKEMRDAGVEEFGAFYIGEPFMSPGNLVKAIEYLKLDLGAPYVFLTSNASLANPGVVEACMRAGLDSLKWSCNAHSKEQFLKTAATKAFWFENALDYIKKAREVRDKYRFKTKLYASSIQYDEKQKADAEEFLEKRVRPYVDEHYWLPLYSAGRQARAREKEMGMKPIAGNTGRLDDPADPLPCWTVFTEAHVRSDGILSACCLDGVGKWKIGDLRTDQFMDAWHSETARALRRAHLKKDVSGTVCEKCVLY